jgi:hypothetical protein
MYIDISSIILYCIKRASRLQRQDFRGESSCFHTLTFRYKVSLIAATPATSADFPGVGRFPKLSSTTSGKASDSSTGGAQSFICRTRGEGLGYLMGATSSSHQGLTQPCECIRSVARKPPEQHRSRALLLRATSVAVSFLFIDTSYLAFYNSRHEQSARVCEVLVHWRQ